MRIEKSSLAKWLLAGWLTAASLALFGSTAAAAPGDEPAAAAPGANQARPQRQYRKFAEGVLNTIPLNRTEAEVVDTPVEGSQSPFDQRKDVVELIEGFPAGEWTPEFDPPTSVLRQKATGIIPRRGIWQLEFTFLPMRVIEVDIPQPDGTMKRRVVWYMVYNVKNTGDHLTSVKQPDGLYEIKQVDTAGELRAAIGPIRFFPIFTLQTHQDKKEYVDQLIPVAVRAIQQKETPNRKLLNTTEISRTPIPLSEEGVDRSVWGVATWTGIDPRTDYFSVYVRGLTNAYRYYDPPGAWQPGDPPADGRKFEYKTLKLNFYKPGDEFRTVEDQIRFGIPGQVDYEWLYRP
ncbi:MAG: hypothetical protein WD030_06015 [Pirellulales bacterium]